MGCTWNRWTIAGQMPPIRIEDKTSKPRPSTGNIQLGRTTLAKKSTAQMSAMMARMFFDGKHCVGVGVGDTRDEVSVRHRQPVAVQPVRDGLDQHEQTEQDRQMDLGTGCDLVAPGL